MKVIMETISGRKGIKNFKDLNEYIDFMTNHGHKIKQVFESEKMPYGDKPVKLTSVSKSDGWEQIDSSSINSLNSSGKSGDCLLPKGSQSQFKDPAKFETSKTSEKADTTETPKVEKQSIKTSQNGTPNDWKDFKYESGEKSSKQPSEKSEKDCKKSCEKSDNKKECEKDCEKESKKDLEEGFRDGLKKAGKYAKGAMVGAGLAGMVATGNPAMAKNINPHANDSDIVKVFDDGSVQDKYGNHFSADEWEDIKNGIDPYSDGDEIMAGEEAPEWIKEELEEVFKSAGVIVEEETVKPETESLNEPADGDIDEKTGNKQLMEDDYESNSVQQFVTSINPHAEFVKTGDFNGTPYWSFNFGQKTSEYTPTRNELMRVKSEIEKQSGNRLSVIMQNGNRDQFVVYEKKPLRENEEMLNETKPARFNKHMDNLSKSFAIISAERNIRTNDKQKKNELNNKRTDKLKELLKKWGLKGYIETMGGYDESGQPRVEPGSRESEEESFFIPNISYEQAMRLGKLFGQDSILFKDVDSDVVQSLVTTPHYNEYIDKDLKYADKEYDDSYVGQGRHNIGKNKNSYTRPKKSSVKFALNPKKEEEE